MVGRAITIESNQGKKQRNYTKREAYKIINNSFTRSNREKSNIAIAAVQKLTI